MKNINNFLSFSAVSIIKNSRVKSALSYVVSLLNITTLCLCRSRPYKFKVRNGGYILLETDWSCFINPWSRKLEFVIGKHTVLKGPAIPNVFAAPAEGPEDHERTAASAGGQVTDEVLKEAKNMQVRERLRKVRCFMFFFFFLGGW